MFILIHRGPWASKQEACARRARAGSTRAYGVHDPLLPRSTGNNQILNLVYLLLVKVDPRVGRCISNYSRPIVTG